MKKLGPALVLALSVSALGQSAHAALNPLLLQQIAQRMVNDVVENDDFVQSLKGEFNTSQTNLENNIAAVQTIGKTTSVPWAEGVVSEATTSGSYRAVYRASRYGVEATAMATVITPVLAAMRYASKEADKEINPRDPYAAETKAVLVQLETVPSIAEAYRLLKELNQVGRHVLIDRTATVRAELVDEEQNGSGGGQGNPPRTNCQYHAQESSQGGSSADYFNYQSYRSCVERLKAELNVLEMTRIVQDQANIEFDGVTITITATDAGGILESASEFDRQSIQKFENRVTKVMITPKTVTTVAQAFVGLRKHEFESIEKEFKTALNRFQAQDPQTISNVDRDLRRILRDVKAFIRKQRRTR